MGHCADRSRYVATGGARKGILYGPAVTGIRQFVDGGYSAM
jgi:hypothetical protein